VTPGYSTALALIAPNAFDLCRSTNSPGIVVSVWQRRSFPLSIRCFYFSVCVCMIFVGIVLPIAALCRRI
jgi:hypothetical protein